MDKIYLKDNYIVTEIGGITAVFPKNYSGYSENTSGFYINSTFPVNNQRTIFIAFSDVGSIYDEAGVTAYTTDTLRTFLLSYTGFKSPSGGSGGGTNFERRSDYVYPYQYSGTAEIGTLDSGTWTIKRVDFTTPGSPITLQATGAWTNRYSLIYV